MVKFEEVLHKFFKNCDRKTAVYNETSFQFELGKYIIDTCEGYSVEFERNIATFGFDQRPILGNDYYKKEMDIIVFKRPMGFKEPLDQLAAEKKILEKVEEIYIIELKFPRNGATTKRKWQFLEDIAFCDQMFSDKSGRVKGTACIVVTDNNDINKRYYDNNYKCAQDLQWLFHEGKSKGVIEVSPNSKYIKHSKLEFIPQSASLIWNKTKKLHYYIVSNPS